MADRTVKVDLSANVATYVSSVERAADSTDELRRKAERFAGKDYKAQLKVDIKDAVANVQRLQKQIAQDNPQLDLDIRKAELKAEKLEADLDKLRKLDASPEVDLKIADAEANLNRVNVQLEELRAKKVTPEVRVELQEALENLARLKADIESVDDEVAKPEVTADVSQAMERLALLNGDLDSLDRRRIEPKAELIVAKAQAEALKLAAELERLGAMEPSPEVDVEIAQASAKLAVIRAELESFNGRNFKATVDLDTKSAVVGVGALVSSIAAFGPAAITAGAVGAGAIGGLTTILGTATAGAVTGALAFSGVGDAISAMDKYAVDPSAANLKKMNQAMAELSVSGQNFARFIQNDLKPKLDQLKNTAQDGLLPGVQKGLTELQGLLPAVNTLIGNTAKAMGDLAARGGAALNDPFWRGYIDFLSREAGPTITAFGEILGNLAKGFAGMQMAFKPVADQIIGGLKSLSQAFMEWATTLDTNQGFQEFVAYVTANGPLLMDTLKQIGSAILALIEAAAPLGPVALEVLRALATALNAILSVPGLGTGLVAIAAGLGAINLALKGVQAVKASALAVALGGIGTGGRNAATGATAAAGGVAAVGGSAGTAATKTSKFGSLIKSAGRSLPIIGTAAILAVGGIEAMTTSFDEASTAMASSGKARDDMLAGMAAESRHLAEVRENYGGVIGAIEQWHDENIRGTISLEEYNRRLEEQRAAMPPLERAQSIASQRQLELNDAIRQFGPGSSAAVAAAQRLAEANGDVELQTQLANKVGMEYYQTLGQLASQAGPAGDAARRLAGGLDTTELAAMGAKVSIDAAGRAVATLPDGRQIEIRANTGTAIFQLGAVNSQVLNIPAGKTVNVGVIGGPAQDALRRIGFEVTTLPDGTVTVKANDAEARSRLNTLVQFGNALQANPQIGADPNLAYDELLRFINEANAREGRPQLRPHTDEANTAVRGMVDGWNAMEGTPDVNANTTPAIVAAEGWRLFTEGLTPTPNVNANTMPAHNAAFQWNNDTQRLEPVPRVNANTGPAWGESFTWNMNTGRLEPVPRVNADTAPATGRSNDWNRYADGLNPEATLNVDTGPANRDAQGFWNTWAGKAITWVARVVSGNAAGGIHMPMAQGGIVNPPIIPNAGGNSLSSSPMYGNKKLRRMPGGGARMVAPNSWRVVGDRLDVPELYAPLDGSGRSLQLIAQGARTFGYDLVKAGAVLGQSAHEMSRRSGSSQAVPQAVNVGRIMAGVAAQVAAAAGGSSNVVNHVTVNNPIAERASDAVQRQLSRMADLGMFADD